MLCQIQDICQFRLAHYLQYFAHILMSFGGPSWPKPYTYLAKSNEVPKTSRPNGQSAQITNQQEWEKVYLKRAWEYSVTLASFTKVRDASDHVTGKTGSGLPSFCVVCLDFRSGRLAFWVLIEVCPLVGTNEWPSNPKFDKATWPFLKIAMRHRA